ncbi:hypothetical protein CGJ24_22910 [Vibrio parahaemolyticus]|nr:hypothetical protein CGJ24_22910 [Vibrio parahaemolyticus]
MVGQGVKYGINRKSIDYFEETLLKLAPVLKDRHFSEEAEWRLVGIVGSMSLSFRAGNSMLIPFKKIPLGNREELKAMAQEIIVGHTSHIVLAKKATQSFLIKSLLSKDDFPINMFPFNVVESRVPYRSW